MCEQVLMKVIGLWFTLSVGGLVAATVSLSVSPAENTKLAAATPSSAYGPVYREPRDYNAHESNTGNGYTYRPYERPQSSRCISCLYASMTGNQERDSYYQQSNRYEGRPEAGGYDRNEYRQNYQDYRGNGYDNRDPMYYNAMRGGNRGYGNRENSYESYYDDRMSNRGYSNSVGGYGQQNYYPERPSNGGYDRDRYYSQGRPYERPERPERPEYYDRPGGYRGGSSSYGYDEVSFRPWDQSYRSSYGDRPGQRPLSTSYLHERDTPMVVSGDNTADSNQEKPLKVTSTTTNADSDRNNSDTTDKTTTTDALRNPIDESNTVSSSTGASDQ